MIYDIIHNIEKSVPHNTKEVHSNVLMPTYRFVTSVDFILGAIVVALVTALVLLPAAFAMTQVNTDQPYINKLYVESNGTNHMLGFQICAGDEPLHNAKVIITSDSDMVVLTTDKPIQENKCRSFGVNINANDADSIHAKLVEPIRA